MRKFIVTTCVAISLLAVGCKTSKSGYKGELREIFEYCELLLSRDKESSTFSARSTISIDLGGESLSSKASIIIERERAVQVSVQPFLGIELFRMQLTTDSLLIIDRTKKRYLAVALEQLPVKISPVVMQSLLLGEPFTLGYDTLTAVQMVEEMEILPTAQKGYKISDTESPLFNIQFTGNAHANIEQILIETKEENSTDYSLWSYSGYDNSAKLGNIPREVITKNNLMGYQLSFSMKYSTPSWEKESKITLAIPKGYKQMKLDELTNLLSL